MAKLPVLKKILREDIKEAPGWVDRMLLPINSFFDTMFSALSRNLTFSENIACQIKEIEFTYTGSWVDVTFAKTLKTKASGCWVIDLRDITTDNYAAITAATGFQWLEGDGEILIKQLPGLTASHKYRLKVIVI
jgi:hypothetical protein